MRYDSNSFALPDGIKISDAVAELASEIGARPLSREHRIFARTAYRISPADLDRFASDPTPPSKALLEDLARRLADDMTYEAIHQAQLSVWVMADTGPAKIERGDFHPLWPETLMQGFYVSNDDEPGPVEGRYLYFRDDEWRSFKREAIVSPAAPDHRISAADEDGATEWARMAVSRQVTIRDAQTDAREQLKDFYRPSKNYRELLHQARELAGIPRRRGRPPGRKTRPRSRR